MKYLIKYLMKVTIVAILHTIVGVTGIVMIGLYCSTIPTLLLIISIVSYVGWLISFIYHPKELL